MIDGPYRAEVYDELEDHMLIEFKATIRIHPFHQALTAAKGWLQTAPKLGVAKKDLDEVRSSIPALEAITQGGDSAERRSFLIFALAGDHDAHRLVLPIQARNLLVALDDFGGTATFVAQVDRILPDGEEVPALRLIRNSPQIALERIALDSGLSGLIEAISELGIETDEKDAVIGHPAVILRPLCMYK